MKREFLQGLKVGENPLPKEVIDAIMAENGRDIEGVKARYADYDALKQAEKNIFADTIYAMISQRNADFFVKHNPIIK